MVFIPEIDGEPHDVLPAILHEIRGIDIERQLVALAKVGGKEIGPGKYAVSRLALSPEDFQARELLSAWMQQAGMDVEHHPLGVIGTYHGRTQDPAVFCLSHFDSVPNGGRYDGVVGNVAGITLVGLLDKHNIRPRRPIKIVALTGEESSRFNHALFGSLGVFHGLTPEALSSRRHGDQSIAEALTQCGFSLHDVTQPRFLASDVHAAVELHVIQDGRLEKSGHDLGIVEAIAAPTRYRLTIGSLLTVEEPRYSHSAVFRLTFPGEAGHSGTTPMGSEHRKDGLVMLSEFLLFAKVLMQKPNILGLPVQLSLGTVSIDGQAMNKIPGRTSLLFRLSADNESAIVTARGVIGNFINRRSASWSAAEAFHLEEDNSAPYGAFFSFHGTFKHHVFAGRVITAVRSIFTREGKNAVVGTVGTYTITTDGRIILGLDFRGMNKETRDAVIKEVLKSLEPLAKKEDITYLLEPFAGNEDPVSMHPRLVHLAEEVIERYGIGSSIRLSSRAGHDIQNAARAGIPPLLLFIPSRNGGISHSPEEYSTPEDLEKGAKALAAVLYTLAMR